MDAELVAGVGTVDGRALRLFALPSIVTLADGATLGMVGAMFRPGQARELAALLEHALAANAPENVGVVLTVDGRPLRVTRYPAAVTVADDESHRAGWTFRMNDQVIALRDAIARAADAAEQALPVSADDGSGPRRVTASYAPAQR